MLEKSLLQRKAGGKEEVSANDAIGAILGGHNNYG